jgi:hypothetical protein
MASSTLIEVPIILFICCLLIMLSFELGHGWGLSTCKKHIK